MLPASADGPFLLHAPRIALFSLDEYESAKEAFEAAHALDKRRESETWIRKCDAELKGAHAVLRSYTGVYKAFPWHTALLLS